MTILEILKTDFKDIKRHCWKNRNYIEIPDRSSYYEGLIRYWDNDKFEWIERKLTLEELTANDWENA